MDTERCGGCFGCTLVITAVATLLTTVFVILKLIGALDWSWGWVIAPMWISSALFVLVTIVACICVVMFSESTEGEDSHED